MDMDPTRRTAVAAAVLGAALALTSAACQGSPAASTREPRGSEAPRPVRVVPAALGSLPRVVMTTGTLAAEQQVALGMKTSGRLGEVLVDLGDRVTKGQPLARLEPIDFQLRVQQAEATLQQARVRAGLALGAADDQIELQRMPVVRQARAMLDDARIQLERAQELSKKQLMPRSELDAIQAAYQVADGRYQDAQEEALSRQALLAQRRSELQIARQQLGDSVLLAPFDGAVRERHTVPGQFVSAGQSIVTLVQTDPLRLRMAIPEREAADVRPGQPVRIEVAGDPAVHDGRVVRLSPAIDERSRTLNVEAEVPNPQGTLRPGAFASAQIVTSADQPVVFVPATAVLTFAGLEKLISVQEGKSVERRIRTGRRHEGDIEIVEGIAAGEEVVIDPGNLVGGQSVVVER
jgi:RND family efflux transporter MFP subunit